MKAYLLYFPLWFLLFTGCAANRAYHGEWRAAQESGRTVSTLADTPFYPQQQYQCGPAALAAMLGAAGVDINPDALASQLYIADRQGSLQIELVAATRRQGLLPYVHSGGFDLLLEQLASGSPVLVLQNLGINRWPRWHYAVVIGYNADEEQVYLRSGTTRLLSVSLREFMRTWQDGNQWFMTAHQPGQIPAGADAEAYLEAVNGLEQAGQTDAALRAYYAATQFWQENWLAWMGLGNRHYLQSEFEPAEHAFRQALELAPSQPAPLHNLAWSLIRQDLYQQALPFAREAANKGDATHYRSALQALQDLL